MAVVKNYTNPTKTDTGMFEVPTFYATPISTRHFILGSRVSKLDYTKQPQALLRAKQDPVVYTQTSAICQLKLHYLHIIFTTYPPLYKTSLGAISKAWTTARVFPPIFITR